MTHRTRAHTRVRTAVPLSIAAAALVVSGAGGAVAGAMVTGAQIKDGTITGADVHPVTKKNFSTVAGYQHLLKIRTIGPDATATSTLKCPAGKHVITAFAWWSRSDEAVQLYPLADSVGVKAFAHNPDAAEQDSLGVSVVCAPVTGNTTLGG